MDRDLTADELRALGCLVEKEATTPDQYPLSINALTAACNQKSNRDPVMSIAEADVRIAVNGLIRRGLARHASGYSGRVSKFEHRIGEGSSNPLKLPQDQLAVLSLLLLRGAQTPGELRARGQRLAEFPDIAAVEAALSGLETHESGPLVVQLPREPGKRETRYMHCLGETEATASAAPEPAASVTEPPANQDPLEARVEALEREVSRLRAAVRALEQNRN
ncbi:MAG: DUF480 domain-containing protein [Ectothiorhodospiraceae bacterium]|jgi:uncharacterized protein YceH (UPF0502 family)